MFLHFQFPDRFFQDRKVCGGSRLTPVLRFLEYSESFRKRRSPDRVRQTENPFAPRLGGPALWRAAFGQLRCSVEEFFHNILVNDPAAMADTPNLELHFQPVAVFDAQTAGTENRNNKPKPSSFYEIGKFISGALGEHLALGDPLLRLGAHGGLYRLEAFLRAAEQLQLRAGVVNDDVRISKQLYSVDIVRQL